MPIFYRCEQRVLFAHVPKTAGTSIEVWFADNGWLVANLELFKGDGGKAFYERFGIHRCQLEGELDPKVSPQHAVAQTYRQWGGFTSGFCMVRDPWRRFLSELGWRFRMRCLQQGIEQPTRGMAASFAASFVDQVFAPSARVVGTSAVRVLNQSWGQ